MSRAILVTGATGKQGGALIKALLSAGSDFQLLAVTRDKNSDSSQRLASKSRQISIVQGDLDNTDAIFEDAKKVTSAPIWGVFSVQAPAFNKNGSAIEERQGKALVDSSIRHGVSHFVYASVDRHGDSSINNKTNIPHFASKHNIEHHLFNSTKGKSGMSWTVLRPVAFMENFDGGFLGKVFASAWKVTVTSRPLQLVATDDIGVFAAKSFLEPEEYKGKCISLAGDELTHQQMMKVFKAKTGSGAPHTWNIVARFVMWMSEEMGTMFSFFEREGYGADVGALKKVYPGMMDLATWLDKKGAKERSG
ncbi:related to nucleoside-diphosphate-sugar epimerases [Cephalotrichum gorgonifer]|uniref:Related to nucleoside-diphosphate-sugar epimerases n=1 Tax=Cephalotrichum gorgonifer TaxID=2041049 RepID=A0AAE8SST7_9PEZI|nr:related to nucleoside-diphosphate-sugar epimerases [Cephalotrichum gorgonifer]